MSFTSLPNDWLESEIGEIAEVIGGGTPKSTDASNFSNPGTGIAWITPADLSGYVNQYISHGARDLSKKGYESSSAKIMPKGSLLFSSRAPIGYIAIAENEVSTNQGFKSFVFTKEIDSRYAYFYFKSIRDLVKSRGTGTTFKEISGANAKKLPFILVPLAEQQQIAAKLEDLLDQVDTIKTRLDTIPKILKCFRQSVLAAAVRGKLTEEWRNNPVTKIYSKGKDVIEQDANAKAELIRKYPELAKKKSSLQSDIEVSYIFDIPSDWSFSTWGKISEWITYGFTKPMPSENKGKRLLTAKDVQFFSINIETSGFTSFSAFENLSDKDRPQKGDLLITN